MKMHAVIEDEETVQTPTRENSQPVATRSPASRPMHKALFADSLWRMSGGQRRWRTGADTCFLRIAAALLIFVLVLVPLWFPDVLPQQQLVVTAASTSSSSGSFRYAKLVKIATDIPNGHAVRLAGFRRKFR